MVTPMRPAGVKTHNGYVWTDQRYFLQGRGRRPGQGVCWRAGQRLLCRLPPLRRSQATLLGSPATTCVSSTLMIDHWPTDAVHQLYRQATIYPPFRTTTPHRPTDPGKATAGPLPSIPGRPVGRPGQTVPTHGEAHQGTLRLRGPTGSAAGQQCRRAQPAPFGGQPQGCGAPSPAVGDYYLLPAPVPFDSDGCRNCLRCRGPTTNGKLLRLLHR